MSNQVTPFQQAQERETLQSLLRQDAYRKRFEQVLSDRAPQFISSIMSIGATMPDVEPRSILASAVIAASLDLSIDKNLGQAWIIPYRKGDRKLAQFQLGSRGITQLALRSACYERMNAKPVNAEALNGYDAVGEPVIDWNKLDETKDPIGYVFAFKLNTGFVKTCYWSKAKVEAHAKRYSQAYRAGYDTPWKTHFTEMALKTIIANELRHWGILSIQMQRGFSEDQGMHTDIDTEVQFPDVSDEITGPKFEAPAKAEEKELADAGLAPQQWPAENPAQTQTAEKVKRTRRAPASAPSQPAAPTAPAVGSTPAAAPSPAPVETQQTVHQAAQEAARAPVAGSLFSQPYNDLRNCMTQSQITDEELITLCRHRGVMTEQQDELLQLSDATIADMVTNWTMVAGQIRQDRRRKTQ